MREPATSADPASIGTVEPEPVSAGGAEPFFQRVYLTLSPTAALTDVLRSRRTADLHTAGAARRQAALRVGPGARVALRRDVPLARGRRETAAAVHPATVGP